MTRDEAAKRWPIYKHYAEGDDVQWSPRYDCAWRDYNDNSYESPLLCDINYLWRIKPKPAGAWGIEMDGKIIQTFAGLLLCFLTKLEAASWCDKNYHMLGNNYRIIKLTEVQDDE